MTQPCLVVVAPADLLALLEPHVASASLELLAFADSDVLAALEIILSRRPRIIAVERQFATTPRGAALVERITSDPDLADCEVRLMDASGAFVTAARRAPLAGLDDFEVEPSPASLSYTAVATPAPGALDQRGTRRAPRHRMKGHVSVLVDGNAAVLIDLSPIGAQVVSQAVLKPNQRVRMALPDETGIVRLNAQIAWASFEIPPGAAPRYRAGLEFVDADPAAVNAFRTRHE